jgi:hypothetical protein
MMHNAHEPSGLTPFRLLGNLIHSRGSSGAPDHSLEAPERWSPLDLERRRELVKEIAERIATDGAPNRHPWRGVCRDALDPSEMEMLRRSLDSVAGDLTRMIPGAEHACALFELPRPETFGEAGRLLAFMEAAATMPECDRQAFRDPVWDSVDDVVQVVEKGVRFSKLKAAFDSAFVETAWNASLDECRTMLMQKGRSLFRLFSSRYRAQVALLNSCLNVPLPKTIEMSSAGRRFDCRASRAPIVRGSSSVWTRGIRYCVAEGTLRLDEVGKLHNVVDRISEGKSSGRCARSFGASDLVGRR